MDMVEKVVLQKEMETIERAWVWVWVGREKVKVWV